MEKLIQILLIFLFTWHNGLAQDLEKSKLDSIDSLILRVENSLSKDWFIVKRNNGFDVVFCRSCNEAYFDTLNSLSSNNKLGGHQRINLINKYSRNYFFKTFGPDSISYYRTVSNRMGLDSNEIREFYSPNDIMKISVDIVPKWNESKYVEIENQNNQLKEEIIKEGLGKTNMSIFEDYRYWIPTQSWLLSRIEKFDFSFQQLPYSSDWFNYSIFIKQDKPRQFVDALFCNPKDKNPYLNSRNYIEDDRTDALTSIAYALGIKDYKILN